MRTKSFGHEPSRYFGVNRDSPICPSCTVRIHEYAKKAIVAKEKVERWILQGCKFVLIAFLYRKRSSFDLCCTVEYQSKPLPIAVISRVLSLIQPSYFASILYFQFVFNAVVFGRLSFLVNYHSIHCNAYDWY